MKWYNCDFATLWIFNGVDIDNYKVFYKLPNKANNNNIIITIKWTRCDTTV